MLNLNYYKKWVFQNLINMNSYQLNLAKYGTHKLIANELGVDQNILDIGCNEGYLKKISPNNYFCGVDFSDAALRIAKDNGYDNVFLLDLNNLIKFDCDKKFDVIVFADILEHLVGPGKALKFFLDNNLKKGGKVIISLPNIANFLIRLKLLFGRFEYTETGILDKTHLHLYTIRTAEKFLIENGLVVEKKKFSSNLFGFFINEFHLFAGLLAYNLIFICRTNSSQAKN